MYLVGLFNPGLVALTDSEILVNFLDPLLGFGFVLEILAINGAESVADGTHIMVLLLLHVFVHALHAHHHAFLLAVEHQRLFVHIALHLEHVVALPAAIVPSLRVVAGLAAALVHIGGFALGVNVASAFGVGHLAEFAFAQLAWPLHVDGLFQFLLAEFGTLHVDEKEFFVVAVDQVLDVEGNGVLAASGAADAKLGVEGWDSFRDFDLFCAVEAEFVLAGEFDDTAALLFAIQTDGTHSLL